MKKRLLLLFLSISFFSKAQTRMTVAEVYDYNIGDIFATENQSYVYPPNYIKVTITNKYYSALLDTVFYVYDYYSYSPPMCPPPCQPTIVNNTGLVMNYTNLNDTIGAGLGSMPQYINGGPCIDTTGFTGKWYDSTYYDTQFCNMLTTRTGWVDNGPYFIDSCIQCFECFPGYQDYGKGVGLKYYTYDECADATNIPCLFTTELLWYKKGIDSCGMFPSVLTTVNQIETNNSINIFPNPTHDNFTINLTGELKIYDAMGRVVHEQLPASTGSATVYFKLSAGVYFVELREIPQGGVRVRDGEKVCRQKLVVE